MKFSIGDKVIFKHTDEEGVVTGYVDDVMMEVEVNGISFPVHIDEIDHPYLKWFTEKKVVQKKKVVPEQLPVEKQKFRKPRLAKGVYLSFIPEFKLEEMEDVVDYIKVFLLNELPGEIQYKYEASFLNSTEFTHEGKLHEFGHVFLHSIPFDAMNDQPKFDWRVDSLDDADMKPMNGQVKMKPQKVFQHIDKMLLNNEPSFNYLLFDEFKPLQKVKEVIELPKVERQPKTRTNKGTAKKRTIDLPETEVDLHIEKLISGYASMSNAEIVQMQLSALHDALRKAIRHKQDRLYVIHGLGKGRLKEEVHKVLEGTIEVESYSNDWHGRYGYGATEVRFEY